MGYLFGQCVCVFWLVLAPSCWFQNCAMAMDSKTIIPVFLSSTGLRSAIKEARFRRVPELQRRFVLNRCLDARLGTEPGTGIDKSGEFIHGMALLQFSASWTPLLVMNDEKRAM